ncbi:HtaA domain-containing protein [Streptomyces sp. NPDC004609]|uniref:HtaA domain-containing protein n=1 Tax=Streptomyces sp. NPDC004609 TaxID=3364704 RepID=UPI0036AD8BE1
MAVPRRPLSIAAAAATAVVLGATALAVPAVASTGGPSGGSGAAEAGPSAPRAPYTLKEGTLDWGFKETFRTYVTGAAKGRIEVADGARQAPDNGPFTFTGGTGTYDMGKHIVDTAFKGSVTFVSTAHGYSVKVADLKLVTEGKSGSVKADVTLNGTTRDDIDLAVLDLSATTPTTGQGGAMVFKDIPATLTADGATAFNGMYQKGQVLDPVTLTVKAEAGKPDPETPEKPEKPEKPERPEKPEKPAGTSAGVLDGNLDWGVKQSFREYVTTGFAQGKIEVAGGAADNAAGFRFPRGKGTFDAGKKTLSVSFDGSVRFLGHLDKGEYVLDLRLSDLKVRVDGTRGTLLADVSTKDQESRKVATYNDLGVASLKVPAGALKAEKKVVTLTDVPATLTADGVKAFGGMYKTGTVLDTLDVSAALDKNVRLPDASGGSGSTGGSGGSGGSTGGTAGSTGGGGTTGGSVGGSVGGGGSTGGSLAATGAGVPTTALLAASAGIAAAGAGVVFATRRRRSVQG